MGDWLHKEERDMLYTCSHIPYASHDCECFLICLVGDHAAYDGWRRHRSTLRVLVVPSSLEQRLQRAHHSTIKHRLDSRCFAVVKKRTIRY